MAQPSVLDKLVVLMRAASEGDELPAHTLAEVLELQREVPLKLLLQLMDERGLRLRGTKANNVPEVMSLLNNIRIGVGISISELARRADISRSHLSALLNGKSENPLLATIGKLGVAIGAPFYFEQVESPTKYRGYNELAGHRAGNILPDKPLEECSYSDLFKSVSVALDEASFDPDIKMLSAEWQKREIDLAGLEARHKREISEHERKMREIEENARKLQEQVTQQYRELEDSIRREHERTEEVLRQQREIEDMTLAARKRNDMIRSLQREKYDLTSKLDEERARYAKETLEIQRLARRGQWVAALCVLAGAGGSLMLSRHFDEKPDALAFIGVGGLSTAGASLLTGEQSSFGTGAKYLGLGSLLTVIAIAIYKNIE